MGFERGHALLIGVGSYQHASGMDVPFTVADAEAVAAVLADEARCAYPAGQVALLTEAGATSAAVRGALADLAAAAKPDDTVLVFYSGHGARGEDGGYLLTTHDTQFQGEKAVSASGIRESELVAALREIKARRLLLIVNACHAGRLSPVLGEGEDGSAAGAALPSATASALLSTGEGRIIITACRDTQYAYVGPGPLTLFTEALVAGLKGEGTLANQGYVGAYDLYLHTYHALADAVPEKISEKHRTKYGQTQEPELTVLKGVGPFPVALYRGATTLGPFDPEPLPEGVALRQVNPERSKQQMQQLARQHSLNISGNARVGVAIAGDAHGPITVGNIGDTTTGDTITVGNISSSSGIAIGRGAQSTVFSGDLRGVHLAIGATLEQASQRVGQAPQLDEAGRAELQELLAQLSAELRTAREDSAAGAAKVAEEARKAAEQVSKPEPKGPLIKITAEGLKRAAENIGAALPAALPIALKIADALAKYTA